MLSRRNFITGSAVALVGAAAVSGRAAAAAIPEAEATPLPPCARRCRRLWAKPTNRW